MVKNGFTLHSASTYLFGDKTKLTNQALKEKNANQASNNQIIKKAEEQKKTQRQKL